jgi:hypothetical protein
MLSVQLQKPDLHHETIKPRKMVKIKPIKVRDEPERSAEWTQRFELWQE